MRSLTLVVVVAIILSLMFTGPLTAKVTKVKATVSPKEWKGKCPKRFEFKGYITSNKPGVVKYKWIRSDNANKPVKTLHFRRPGTLPVSSYWQLSAQGKHWQAIEVLAPNHIKSNKAVFKLKCIRRPRVATAQRVRPGTVRATRPVVAAGMIQLACPDPAVVDLKFSIVRRHTQFRGRIRVTAVIKNVGKKPFLSGPNQAKAYLYQLPSGLPPNTPQQGTIVAQRAITNLPAGASFQLTYEREWNSSSPNEGEFPNSYRCMILYDPDIRMDANKNNDDCNNKNNRKERSGTDINDMLK